MELPISPNLPASGEHPVDAPIGLLPQRTDPLRYGGQSDDPSEAPGILLSNIPEGSVVLDVGCGSGAITRLIRDKRRCHVIGIEPNPPRARAARQAGLEVINDVFSSRTVGGLPSFDAVVFADVLEHLVDPAAALTLARTLIRPGGCVVASVPNVAHWSVRLELLRGRFDYTASGIMDATHLRWFTKATLVALVEAAGYDIATYSGSAGLWMPVYRTHWAFRRLGSATRTRVVTAAVRRWPALFACQHVFKATPRR